MRNEEIYYLLRSWEVIMLTMTIKSKLKDVWQDPIGRNALLNLDNYLRKNEGVSIQRLSANAPLYKVDFLAGDGFSETLVSLMNQEDDTYSIVESDANPTWWKESVIYQIFLPSFMDADHDGFGDFAGVIQRLPYLERIGVNTLWFAPFIYSGLRSDRSASNFETPYPDFGDIDDFERLAEAAHMHGMRIVVGLDISTTTDEHPWFQAALKDPTSKWYQYYNFCSGTEQMPPNNWGKNQKGWKWYPAIQAWALRMLGGNRMQLNWENPEVREEIANVLSFWCEKGVDGFCLGSFSIIAKSSFRDGMPCFASSAGVVGYEYCAYNPVVHKYLGELRKNIKADKEPLLIGATAGMTPLFAGTFTDEQTKELDMILDLSHLLGKINPSSNEEQERVSLLSLKQYYLEWMDEYGYDHWMSLVFGNSKFPRIVSRVGVSSVYRSIAAKLLATMQFTLRGTPIVYQGEELGLPNLQRENAVKECDKTPDERAAAVQAVIRDGFDYARAPMPWASGANGGFTGADPWIGLMDGIDHLNVNTQLENNKSVLNYYCKLIAMRKKSPALIYGEFKPVFVRSKKIFCYFRVLDNEKWYIEMNLTDKVVRRERVLTSNLRLITSNYDHVSKRLRPYEANIYRCE